VIHWPSDFLAVATRRTAEPAGPAAEISVEPAVLAAFAPSPVIAELAELVGKVTIRGADGVAHALQTSALGRAVGRILGEKVAQATPEDGRRVLKLSDAIDVVVKWVNDFQSAAQLSKWIVPFPLPGTDKSLASAIIAELRTKVLFQYHPLVTKDEKHRTRKG
jgi:hypothetical protein